jgi:hypothetical protein
MYPSLSFGDGDPHEPRRDPVMRETRPRPTADRLLAHPEALRKLARRLVDAFGVACRRRRYELAELRSNGGVLERPKDHRNGQGV